MEKSQTVISPEFLKKVRQESAEGLVSFYKMVWPEFEFPDHLWPLALALTDNRIDNLMAIVGPGSGKSLLVSQAWPAWGLGHHSTDTFMCISASAGLPEGFVKSAMQIIEFSPAYKLLFPNVLPDKDAGWSNTRGAFVTGRRIGNPDASYVGFGLQSKELTGKHATRIILDDVHDDTNSQTSFQRKKVIDTYYKQLIGRADPQGARFIVVGRRWATDDLYGHILGEDTNETSVTKEDWVIMTLPAERKGTNPELWWDILVGDNVGPNVFGETGEI